MAWPISSSRTVYANRWIRVDEDAVTMPDGSSGVYGVVTLLHDAVFVVALDDDERVVLVELDRHTVGRSIEVPAGGTDGEDPLVAARRELREETGLEADRWERIGGMTALNGVCRAAEHVFLARGLRVVDAAEHGRREEGIADVRRVPLDEVLSMATRGEIADSETLAALLLTVAHLRSASGRMDA